MFPEYPTDEVESDGIGTRIQIAQTKSDDSQIMPEIIVQFLCSWIEIEKQHEGVKWSKADCKYSHKYQYSEGDFLPCLYLKEIIN